MSLKSSGLWCDLCRKPILLGEYWNIRINGKEGHSCDKCADGEYKKAKEEYLKTLTAPSAESEEGDMSIWYQPRTNRIGLKSIHIWTKHTFYKLDETWIYIGEF